MRILLGLVALILIVLILVTLLAGPIAKNYLEKNDLDLVGRQIEVADIDFSAFSGNLFLKNVIVYEPDSKNSFISFDRLSVFTNLWPLVNKRVSVDSVGMDKLVINLQQKGNEFNFQDIIDHFSKEENKDTLQEKEGSSNPWTFKIGPIVIAGSQVDYLNVDLDQKESLNRWYVHSDGISSDTGLIVLETHFNFEENTGTFNLDGSFDYKSLVYQCHLLLERFSIEWMKKHLDAYANVSSLDGFLTADMIMSGNFKSDFTYQGRGAIDLADFRLTDMNADSVVKVKEVFLALDSFASDSMLFQFSKLEIDKPYLHYVIYPEGDNFSMMSKAPDSPADTMTADGGESIKAEPEGFNIFYYLGQYAKYLAENYAKSDYAADSITLSEGSVHFEDFSLRGDNAQFLLDQISLHSSELNTRDEKVDLLFSTTINRISNFEAEWKVNPQDVLDMDLDYKLRSLSVTSLSPYSYTYTAYPFTNGNLLFEGEVLIHEENLESENHLLIEELNVASKQYEDPPVDLPLKTAVAVIKDTKGNIDLKIPVNGSLKNPNFTYWKVVGGFLKDLILKAVASPYKILASQFKVEENLLEEVPYAYGAEFLSKDGRKHVKAIAKVLRGKDEMNLHFYNKSNAQLEKDFLAVEHVKRMYLEENPTYTEEVPDSIALLNLSPKDTMFYQFILAKSPIEDRKVAPSEHCRSIMGAKALEDTYRRMVAAREDNFRNAFIAQHKIDPSRLVPWIPKKEIVMDTINLFRPTYLVNFDLINGSDSTSSDNN